MASVKRSTAASVHHVQRREAPPQRPVAEAKTKGWVPGAHRVSATAAGAKPVAATKVAPKEAVELPLNQYSLADRQERRFLVGDSPQVNPLSRAAGNAGDICGGAVMVNALVLGSTTPEAAKANAKALKTMADQFGAWNHLPAQVPRPAVQAALEHLSAGSMNSRDVQLLQQLTYAAGRSLMGTREEAGLTAPAIAGVLTQLRHDGAQVPPDTRLVEVFKEDSKAAKGGSHWVTVADGVYVNSNQDPGKPGDASGEALMQADIPAELSPKHGIFDGDVRVSGSSEVLVRMRAGKADGKRLDPGVAYQFAYDSRSTYVAENQFKLRAAFEADLGRAARAAIAGQGTKVE